MKKGEAVLFTMKSSSFKPHILFGTNQAIIVMGNPNESSTESKATFLAPADTAFYIIFTSLEENKTGKFSYGYNLLTADQVIAINNAKKNQVDRFSTGNLGKQLLELLDHSKNGFKAIRGEKTDTKKYTDPWTTSVTNYYKTTYLLDGTIENKIEELYRNEKYMENPDTKFIALFAKELTKAEGENLFNRVSTQLKQEFASGFTPKEFKDDYSGGGYHKMLWLMKSDDKKHYISLEITFNPGVGIITSDNASVKISVN
jgi:hypothetical protein